ncbi:hypothetical protein EMIT040CA3_290153 [Bacillus pseudomycoides]
MKRNFYFYYVLEKVISIDNDDGDIMLNIGAYILFLFIHLVTKKVFICNIQK